MNLADLYQEVIVDHNKSPRNFHKLAKPTVSQHGHNPLCGDEITLYLSIDNGVIEEVSFQGHGCAISTASASLMTEALKGEEVTRALELFEAMHQLFTKEGADSDATIGKLAVLNGVKNFPMRVKCATLAWHTLKAALSQQHDTVTTE